MSEEIDHARQELEQKDIKLRNNASEISNLENKSENLEKELSDVQQLLNTTKQECNDLKENVEIDLERKDRELSDKTGEISNLKNELDILEKKLNENLNRNAILVRIIGEIKGVIERDYPPSATNIQNAPVFLIKYISNELNWKNHHWRNLRQSIFDDTRIGLTKITIEVRSAAATSRST